MKLYGHLSTLNFHWVTQDSEKPAQQLEHFVYTIEGDHPYYYFQVLN